MQDICNKSQYINSFEVKKNLYTIDMVLSTLPKICLKNENTLKHDNILEKLNEIKYYLKELCLNKTQNDYLLCDMTGERENMTLDLISG